jgi:hypothetical protein
MEMQFARMLCYRERTRLSASTCHRDRLPVVELLVEVEMTMVKDGGERELAVGDDWTVDRIHFAGRRRPIGRLPDYSEGSPTASDGRTHRGRGS